jgi:hypothetical protein
MGNLVSIEIKENEDIHEIIWSRTVMNMNVDGAEKKRIEIRGFSSLKLNN